MRFMMMVMGDLQGKPPGPELMAAIDELGKKARREGKLLMDGGLKPASATVRVGIEKGKPYTVDGPFAETKEVVGGFAIFELPSREAAIEEARKFVDAHARCGITGMRMEIRPFMGPEDFAQFCRPEAAAAG